MPAASIELRTAYPRAYHDYVRVIAEDRGEYLAWRAAAGIILRKLGRAHEATGSGPQWPLENVMLID